MNIVVSDAGPLIGLSRINLLTVLRKLFGSLVIPPAVSKELGISSRKPGSNRIADALNSGWIKTCVLKHKERTKGLLALVDSGEAEAIQLALEQNNPILLIDDKKGRNVAMRLGLRIVGTGGILVAAKRAGHIEAVSPILEALSESGYRLSSGLCERIKEMAQECPPPAQGIG